MPSLSRNYTIPALKKNPTFQRNHTSVAPQTPLGAAVRVAALLAPPLRHITPKHVVAQCISLEHHTHVLHIHTLGVNARQRQKSLMAELISNLVANVEFNFELQVVEVPRCLRCVKKERKERHALDERGQQERRGEERKG